MSFFDSFSKFANQSTIYKRHEARNKSHQVSSSLDATMAPNHPSHQPTVDSSLGVTIRKFGSRSTIYNTHELHHVGLKHNVSESGPHMNPNMNHHHDSLLDTVTSMPMESSIYERNCMRNQFLHHS